MKTIDLIRNFLDLQNSYSFTKRALITAERYVNIAHSGLVDKKDYSNEILREPLMEHVGHLPIMASYFHPHIRHSKDVDLGRSLIMLSIHDIGETVTGEIFSYHRTKQDDKDEIEAARKIIHPDLKVYLEEFEESETLDAKYAKSIDALAPNIYQVCMPKITMARFNSLNATVDDIVDKKRKLMEWDSVLLEIFDLLMEQYDHVDDANFHFKTFSYDDI